MLAAFALLLTAVSVTALAQAQTPTVPAVSDDPCLDANQEAGQELCDTELTPVPKDTKEFTRIAGAEFDQIYDEENQLEGPTRYTVDLFGTDFFGAGKEGFFVGAQCINTNARFADTDDNCEAEEYVGPPERAPAIYHYTTRPDGVSEIHQVYGPEVGNDEPGYVAAVAWIGSGRAIAVGGTGHYPRRELPPREAEPGELPETPEEYAERDLAGEEPNAAGEARVWLYKNQHWIEQKDLPGLHDGNLCDPDTDPECTPMGGLTTVDCSPRKQADGELCLAGGFRQLWKWQGDGFGDEFTEAFTPTSTDDQDKLTVDDGAGWRFRVREVQFSTIDPLPIDAPQAIAVTSGCCAQTRNQDSARVLLFDGETWKSRLLLGDQAITGNDPARRSAVPSQTTPESFYATGARSAQSVLLASGRPAGETEPRSAVVGYIPAADAGAAATGLGPQLVSQLSTTKTGSARLVAADGDFEAPNNVVDWAVGVLRSTGQGLAFNTRREQGATGSVPTSPLTCDPLTQLFPGPLSPADCEPRDTQDLIGQTKSGSLVAVDTYALNGFAFTPSGGTGWAVGDKGAIACLDCAGSASSEAQEPDPDRVGGKTTASVSGSSAYQGLGSGAGGDVGIVPSLASRPTVELPEPKLIPAGSPNPRSGNTLEYQVKSVVMSRDGSEGWAVGGNFSGLPGPQRQDILFHFDGVRWSVCDPEGIPGQVDPDPACADLAPLMRNQPPVQLRAAARVPLENDSDPTNDNEFEVVALGSSYRAAASNGPRPAVLRYRDGRWSVDEQAMRELNPTAQAGAGAEFHSIVFTAPADGWAISVDKNTVAGGLRLAHYDGTKWTVCAAQPSPACGDPDGVLPLNLPSNYRLTAADRRVYLGGTRTTGGQVNVTAGETYPFIASIDTAADAPRWEREYDPGVTDPGNPSGTGRLTALSVTRGPGDRYQGWAAGLFAGAEDNTNLAGEGDALRVARGEGQAALLRLDTEEPNDPDCRDWCLWSDGGAADDYLYSSGGCDHFECQPTRLLGLTSESGEQSTFLTAQHESEQGLHPMLRFDEERCPAEEQSPSNCWTVQPTPFTMSRKVIAGGWGSVVASAHAMAPDGQGGFWLATRQGRSPSTEAKDIFFYHYTDREPAPVFEEAPHPIREEITDAAQGPSGELWVTTRSGIVYRYDRVVGWDRFPVPGWDRGNVITVASPANAVAVGDDGTGVVVGAGGRIADIGPGGVRLNAAAGIGCGVVDELTGPCTSGFDLISAAVAADGSALVGGEGRALLCRSSSDQGGQFHRVPPPPGVASNAVFTGISMPESATAYLTTDTGQVFAGSGSCGSWSWSLENVNEKDQLITLNAAEQGMRLNAVSVDASGHGFAVGERGLLLERRPGAAEPWKRVQTGVRGDLHSVALPRGAGSGALIGGQLGLVLTLRDGRFEVARTDDVTDPITAGIPTRNTGQIVGLGLSGGRSDGQVEAWAVSQVPSTSRPSRRPTPGAVLHYTSAPDEPLLDGGRDRAAPLPDVSAPSDSELTVAAFGRSDCVPDVEGTCREFQSSSIFNQLITTRATDEILASADDGGVDLALFTGDVNRAAGRDDVDAPATPIDVDVIHRRWIELVAERFGGEGPPLYGAIGPQDLSQAQACNNGCNGTRSAGVGTSGPWQRSFAGRWPGAETSHGDLTFKPLAGGSQAENPTGGGAPTHYAVDILRSGDPVARLIVLDNSFRSLAASDPQQNPVEEQQQWLTQMLCERGSAQDLPQVPCTREPAQRAVVLMSTPTYSYNTQASGGGVETTTDQAILESALLTGQADAVISGRLGWNGLYYTVAPGLHSPCLGNQHPAPDGSDAPAPGGAPRCNPAGGGDQPELPEPPSLGGAGALPTLVASGAGGTFGPPSSPINGAASAGFWHGYSLLHLNLESGAARVEQRPIFDWLGIRPAPGTAATRALRAKKRLSLEGFGREAAAADPPLRYDEITSHAITHRYDLLAAHPDQPWLAASDDSPPSGISADGPDNCGPYVCLPGNIGSIDRLNGLVTAGNGAYPRTYAVAMLSVGKQSATYPLAFEPRASFRTAQPPPPVPVAVPPPPPPPAPAQPTTPSVNLPAAPVLPVLTAQALAPPPVPPSPPVVASQAPLDTNISPAALNTAPPTAVTQPPTPPVNPAPPGGARREARQRQAAAQKSGADNAEEGEGSDGVDPSDAQNRVNPVDSAHQGATRIEPGRETHPFTALPNADQPSAWSRGLLYGGGLTLAALILAFGLRTARPTPRRREPELPAPAFAKERTNRR